MQGITKIDGIFTIRIFGGRRYGCFQRLGLALGVYSFDTELVILALVQTRYICLWSLAGTAWYPTSGVHIHPFDDIMVNRFATVVVGFVPFQLATFGRHVGHFEWSFRFARFAQNLMNIKMITNDQLYSAKNALTDDCVLLTEFNLQ